MIKFLKMGLISSLILSSLRASSRGNGVKERITFWQDNDMRYSKSDIVQFIEKNGFDVTEDVRDTENLVVDGHKLIVENGKKMMLLRVVNKIGAQIDVEKDLGYGDAFPKVLKPFATGFVVVQNEERKPIKKYDVISYNDNLAMMLNTKNLTNIHKYFDDNVKIYEMSSLKVDVLSKSEFIRNHVNEYDYYIVDRVDRVVDDNSFRYGLFTNGFIRVSKEFYKPLTMYSVVYEGRIVKLYYINETLKWEDFKKFMYLHKNK